MEQQLTKVTKTPLKTREIRGMHYKMYTIGNYTKTTETFFSPGVLAQRVITDFLVEGNEEYERKTLSTEFDKNGKVIKHSSSDVWGINYGELIIEESCTSELIIEESYTNGLLQSPQKNTPAIKGKLLRGVNSDINNAEMYGFFEAGKLHNDNGPAYVDTYLPPLGYSETSYVPEPPFAFMEKFLPEDQFPITHKTYRNSSTRAVKECWCKFGIPHRDDGPALTRKDGSQEYYKEGKLHREDGPARIENGVQYWFKEGKLHREDGPAMINCDGTEKYYKEGKLHREDGPAVINKNGSTSYYKNGSLDIKTIASIQIEKLRTRFLGKQTDAENKYKNN